MKIRILDFDIENRPLSYLGDWTTGEVTAIAACWAHTPRRTQVWLLGPNPESALVMLTEFRKMYDAADVVTGHYIRKHDLPIINGAMLEHGLPALAPKLASDTKTDLLRRKYLSASQESLAGLLGVPASKIHMTQAQWREANRLTPEGLKLTAKRAKGDVIQHMAMRKILNERGWLAPPRMWNP